MALSRLVQIFRNRLHAATAPLRRLYQMATRRRQIEAYLRDTAEPRLILGAGTQQRPGWLSSDLDPRDHQTIRIDATKRLPFPDGSLACVFAEHMIEHIDYWQGQALVREVRRVLRPGGVLRIATPDLVRLARLVCEPLDAEAQAYVDWSNGLFGEHVGNRPSFVLNRAMRWWGHTFVYDVPTLRDLLENAGFVELAFVEVGESRHDALRGLEHHGDVVSQAANRFETIVVEAVRP